ncbi:hypothetical protein LP422_24205 [Janibacter limosus]|nr:hypothetical protein [Janibacter limosus]WKV15939.1 hypothetical protein LP422_24205 [Janibacter limosus]
MATATPEFIGTATSLVRLGKFTLLTDPNFGSPDASVGVLASR